MRYSIALLFIFYLVSSCSFGKKEQPAIEDSDLVAQATFVSYTLETINDRKGPCEKDSLSSACLEVNINYPMISKGPNNQVLDSINHHIKEDIFKYAFLNEKPESFEKLIDEMSLEYQEILTEFPDYVTSWSLEISSDIIFQSTKFISIATTIFSYTGGAHPNSYLVYKSYDLNTGKPIELEDLLVENYLEPLNRSAEIEFRMNHEIPPSRKLSESGFIFDGDEFRLNDNFAIINQSLVFYFNSYEISSYAQGPSELELKLTDYVSLIKPGSVIDGF